MDCRKWLDKYSTDCRLNNLFTLTDFFAYLDEYKELHLHTPIAQDTVWVIVPKTIM